MPGPTTNPGEVWIIGNRRPAGGSGPYGGGANGGGGPGRIEGGVEADQLPDEPNGPPPYEYDPCDSAPKRIERAIDAAAAAALREFERLAGLENEGGLNVRERGAYLFLMPNGTVEIGPIKRGEETFSNGGVGTTGDLELGGHDVATLVGSIHSHSVGSYVPSRAPNGEGDVGHFYGMVQSVTNVGGNPDLVRLYIAAQKTVGAGESQYYAIHIFNAKNIEENSNSRVPDTEVDPNGVSCPPQ